MSITTHVQALTTALNAIDNHLASMLDHGVTPDQYKAIEPDLIALEHTINHHATIAAQTTPSPNAPTPPTPLAPPTSSTTSPPPSDYLKHAPTTASISPTPSTPYRSQTLDLATAVMVAIPTAVLMVATRVMTTPATMTPTPNRTSLKTANLIVISPWPRISAEKHAIITDELARLNPNTTPSAEELRTQALSQAIWRTPEDLRTWLRHHVTTATKTTPTPSPP
nr:hypothetical protein [Corynebacterium glutamicum]